MSDVVLEMDHVYKKFKRGELHDSLRDLIPAMARKILRGKRDEKLGQKEFWALQDVTFQVSRGMAFGIIGHNGAGKSTILKHLSGIMKPTRGAIKVHGRLSALIEVGAGFHPDLTGRENVFLNGTILGMTRQEIVERFDQIVAFAGLEDFIDTPVKRYSSGMYARLGFSVAAHVNPDLLLVDEVLSVGDWAFQRKCVEKMQSIIGGGATVIFISHNLKAVSSLCQRAMLLDHGQVSMIGETEAVIRKYMEGSSAESESIAARDVYISSIRIANRNGEDCVQFRSGEQARFEIEITANTKSEKAAIAFSIQDERSESACNSSNERLGLDPFNLEPGQTARCVFEMTLHLAPGMYHLAVLIIRYDSHRIYDRRNPAATFYVNWDEDVKGVAHLYPRVVENKIERG